MITESKKQLSVYCRNTTQRLKKYIQNILARSQATKRDNKLLVLFAKKDQMFLNLSFPNSLGPIIVFNRTKTT